MKPYIMQYSETLEIIKKSKTDEDVSWTTQSLENTDYDDLLSLSLESTFQTNALESSDPDELSLTIEATKITKTIESIDANEINILNKSIVIENSKPKKFLISLETTMLTENIEAIDPHELKLI